MSNISLAINELGDKYFDYRQDCWGNSYTWDFERSLNQVIKLAIHHSVTKDLQNKTGKQQVDEIGQIHQIRGYAGFGYHFVIDTEGKVWYVGDIGTGRANITNNNAKIIGICLIGDFTKHLPTASQVHSAHVLCKFFLFHYPALININNWNDVIGHKEAISLWSNATATACPGSNWKIEGDNLYNRIVNDIWQGYPAPSPSLPIPQPPSPPPDPCEQIKAEKEVLQNLINQVKGIIYDKGYIWQKINKLKQLLPK